MIERSAMTVRNGVTTLLIFPWLLYVQFFILFKSFGPVEKIRACRNRNMAAFSRSVCSRHFRSVLSYCKHEQLNPLVRKVSLNQYRPFSANSSPGRFVIAQSNLLYFTLGGVAAGVAYSLWEARAKDRSAVSNDTLFKPKIHATLPFNPPARRVTTI